MINRFFKTRNFVVVVFLSIITACGQKVQSQNKNNQEILSETSAPSNAMYPEDQLVISTHSNFTKKHYPERIVEFRKNPLVKNDIVFLGNSITEQGGNWAKRLNNSKVKNRGISGDTTEGVLARLGEVICCEPKQVFILIGINDLFRDDMTSEMVFTNIMKIVNQIHEKSPNTQIFVHTILPTSTIRIKEKIQMTNNLLVNAASKEPFQLVELHEEFKGNDGLMKMQFSEDGVHLNESGYDVWVKKIINLI